VFFGLVPRIDQLLVCFPQVRWATDQPVYPVLDAHIGEVELQVPLGLDTSLTCLFQVQGDQSGHSEDGHGEQGNHWFALDHVTKPASGRAIGPGLCPGADDVQSSSRIHRHGRQIMARRQGELVLMIVVVLT
jgi:hypothetical protein